MTNLLLFALLLQAPAPQDPPAPAPTIVKTDAKQLAVDGQFRFRFEYRDPAGYDTVANVHEDDDLFMTRIRLNFKYAVQDDLDVFVQLQDARTFGEEASVASNEKNVDLKQGWIEVRKLLGQPLTLKLGRQELAYGDGRVLSPLDWNNITRSFDGAKLRWAGDDWWVDFFYMIVKEGTGAEDDQDFTGLYASYTGWKDHEVDLYFLVRELNNNAFTGENGVVGDVRDQTIGARLKGKQSAFDYSLEFMLQSGDYVEDSIKANAYAATFGYTFDMAWKPRVGLELTQASGDADPADGDHESYDPLFAFGHFYQGFADQFAFRNGRDVALYVKIAPCEGVTVHLDLHTFTLDEERDSWFNASGAQIRRDATGNSDAEIGREIDLHARWSATKAVKFWFGFALFQAGEFVEDTGSSPDMLWFFLQTVVDF